jgi:hypothetical protein
VNGYDASEVFMARIRIFLALLAVSVVAAGGPVEARDLEDGELAPDGCWTMAGGCPARSGAARTEGVRGPLEPAWSIDLGEEGQSIAAEPRVWQNRIFLSVSKAAGERALHVLSLGDGRSLATPLDVEANMPLEFGVWEDAVLVREGPATIALYQLRGGRFHLVWRAEAQSAFFSPILFHDRVLVLDGEDVVGFEAGSGTEAWRRTGRYRGGLAAAWPYLYVLESDTAGNLELVPIDIRSGTPRPGTFVGTYQQQGPPRTGVIADISVHPTNVFVQHHQDLRTTAPGRRTSRVGRTGQFLDSRAGVLGYRRLPVAAGANWLVTEVEPDRGLVLRLTHDHENDPRSTQSYILADRRRHPDFPRTPVPFTVAGKMAYVGARAFEWDSRQVTWVAGGGEPSYRPVPAWTALLVVSGKRRITCFRERGAGAGGAMFLGPAHALGTATPPQAVRHSGVVLYIDETWHEGDFRIDPTGERIVAFRKRGKREQEDVRTTQEVALVLDAQDRILYTSSMHAIARLLDRWNFQRRAADYDKLARAAYKTYDAELMARLIDEASRRGISAKKLEFPRKQHAGLVRRPRKVNQKKKAKIEADIEEMKSEDARRLRRALESPLEDPRWPIQKAFARRLLRDEPLHPRVTSLVKSRFPTYLDVPDPFRPAKWIDFVDQLQHIDVRRIDPPIQGSKDLTPLQREYGSALMTWRKDLVALQSEDLLILTPLARPGRVAGCLAMGTMVCDALEAVFRAGQDVRTDPWPLILRLYETQKEFMDVALEPGASDFKRKQVEWTGGHYDPGAGISRIYLPENPDGWETVMSVYAHELTHHWIAERCPLFKASERKRLGGIAGYWIVEGMATFLQEFQWNLADRTWSAENPAAGSLDIVANATPQQLHPWRTVYGMPQIAFGRLKRFDADREVPVRWRLGFTHKISDAGMFYAQASATCHYLFHAGEDLRKRLLEYVRAYYTGSIPRGQETAQLIIGMSPEQLGARVVKYARVMNARR